MSRGVRSAGIAVTSVGRRPETGVAGGRRMSTGRVRRARGVVGPRVNGIENDAGGARQTSRQPGRQARRQSRRLSQWSLSRPRTERAWVISQRNLRKIPKKDAATGRGATRSSCRGRTIRRNASVRGLAGRLYDGWRNGNDAGGCVVSRNAAGSGGGSKGTAGTGRMVLTHLSAREVDCLRLGPPEEGGAGGRGTLCPSPVPLSRGGVQEVPTRRD